MAGTLDRACRAIISWQIAAAVAAIWSLNHGLDAGFDRFEPSHALARP